MDDLYRPSRSFLNTSHVGDGDSGLSMRGFTSGRLSFRRSVTSHGPKTPGYSNPFPNASTSQLPSSSETLPTYDDATLPPPKAGFKVTPREDEGCEKLPAYSCSLYREACFSVKKEMNGPFPQDRSKDRCWKQQYLVLAGTKLSFHQCKELGMFSKKVKNFQEPDDDHPYGISAGKVVKSYTLQGAEVGVAGDYKKRHFVIRLRLEGEQLLISCNLIETFLLWMESLACAIDLSPPLEERRAPKYRTIPRRRRRQFIREDIGDMNLNQFPSNEDNDGAVDAAIGGQGDDDEDEAAVTASRAVRPDLLRTTSEATVGSAAMGHPEIARSRTTPNLRTLHFNEEGKWAPPHPGNLDGRIQVRYARRCLAQLHQDAPRPSETFIKNGKRFEIDYLHMRAVPYTYREVPVSAAVVQPQVAPAAVIATPAVDSTLQAERGDPPSYADMVVSAIAKGMMSRQDDEIGVDSSLDPSGTSKAIDTEAEDVSSLFNELSEQAQHVGLHRRVMQLRHPMPDIR